MDNEPKTSTTETPKPEGAILAIDSSIADPPPALDAPEPEQPKQQAGAFMTPQKLMGLLKKMIDTEQITPEQARTMRQQFGIKQSYFTGKKTDLEKKKTKKAAAQASRVANRYNASSKGQKRNQGRGD